MQTIVFGNNIKSNFVFLLRKIESDENKKTTTLINLNEAIEIARSENKELIQISFIKKDNEIIPVCVIEEIGKYKYLIKKKKNSNNEGSTQIKKINIKYLIDNQDLEIKINKIKDFLQKQNQVKILFKRMRGFKSKDPESLVNISKKIIQKLEEDLKDHYSIFQLNKNSALPEIDVRPRSKKK